MQAGDQALDLFCAVLGTLGQRANLVSDHSKTTALLTCTRRFDGRVERQQVGLLGDVANHLQHTADTRTFLIQVGDGLGRLFHFTGQTVDLIHGLLHNAIALLCLQVGITCGQRGLLGVLRHFLHGRSHLVHGGSGLLGFKLLRLHTGAGLRGNG